ncbi:hypothetical protein SLE2022_261440 [Rubroshorea leprosula]
MGMRKMLPSPPASFAKALSSSSASQQSALTTCNLFASSIHASTPATSNSKSFVPNPHFLHQFLTKQCKFGAITLHKVLQFFD